MSFFTTLLATIAVATAIAYNSDTVDGTTADGGFQTKPMVMDEVPPPAPPPTEISISGEE